MTFAHFLFYAKRGLFTLIGVFSIVYLTMILVSYSANDPSWSHVSSDMLAIANMGGARGAWLSDLLLTFVGRGIWCVLLFVIYEIVLLWWHRRTIFGGFRFLGYVFLLFAFSALLSMKSTVGQHIVDEITGNVQIPLSIADNMLANGGIIGYELAVRLQLLLNHGWTWLFLMVFVLIMSTLAFDIRWRRFWTIVKNISGIGELNHSHTDESADSNIPLETDEHLSELARQKAELDANPLDMQFINPDESLSNTRFPPNHNASNSANNSTNHDQDADSDEPNTEDKQTDNKSGLLQNFLQQSGLAKTLQSENAETANNHVDSSETLHTTPDNPKASTDENPITQTQQITGSIHSTDNTQTNLSSAEHSKHSEHSISNETEAFPQTVTAQPINKTTGQLTEQPDGQLEQPLNTQITEEVLKKESKQALSQPSTEEKSNQVDFSVFFQDSRPASTHSGSNSNSNANANLETIGQNSSLQKAQTEAYGGLNFDYSQESDVFRDLATQISEIKIDSLGSINDYYEEFSKQNNNSQSLAVSTSVEQPVNSASKAINKEMTANSQSAEDPTSAWLALSDSTDNPEDELATAVTKNGDNADNASSDAIDASLDSHRQVTATNKQKIQQPRQSKPLTQNKAQKTHPQTSNASNDANESVEKQSVNTNEVGDFESSKSFKTDDLSFDDVSLNDIRVDDVNVDDVNVDKVKLDNVNPDELNNDKVNLDGFKDSVEDSFENNFEDGFESEQKAPVTTKQLNQSSQSNQLKKSNKPSISFDVPSVEDSNFITPMVDEDAIESSAEKSAENSDENKRVKTINETEHLNTMHQLNDSGTMNHNDLDDDPFAESSTSLTTNAQPSSTLASETLATLPELHDDDAFVGKSRAFQTAKYRKNLSPIPSLEILDKPDPDRQPSYTSAELEQLSDLLEIKLQDFNIKAEVVNAIPGPVVTRFEVELAPGVKASKVVNISRDLARSLSMASLRVVEVIPGKPYIGIEVPNRTREMVRLIELLDTDKYRDPNGQISMAMGKNIGGKPIITDLAKAPHMLVAGTTGSGKSVLVNSMLLSMLLKYTPEELRLILIDPKQLELANYNDIPHLLTPVVTDMTEAAGALAWCVAEMERRYQLMSLLRVRKLKEFNKKVIEAEKEGNPIIDPLWRPNDSVSIDKAPKLKPLPMIVIVADEFADMIMQVGKQAEELITRLAQKSRAAGIHLMLATQRPSVDVITGLIKANVPVRAALRVNSKVDSRTILDQGGAEDMLGNGDMLFLGPGQIEPERVHGAFVSDEEVNRVCEAWRERGAPDYIENFSENFQLSASDSGSGSTSGGTSGEDDSFYNEAVAFVLESRKVSASSIQRKFSIGYNRAARIVDSMEQAGIVSPMIKGKREILV